MARCLKCSGSRGFLNGMFRTDPLCPSCRAQRTYEISRFEQAVDQATADKLLTEAETVQVESLIAEYAINQFEAPVSYGKFQAAMELTKLSLTPLTVIDAVSIQLTRDENCHYVSAASLLEIRSRTQYVGGSHGVSFRIAKGVSYRVGGFRGERISTQYTTVTDTGRLYLTNSRVIFSGALKTVTYKLKDIVEVKKYEDGIEFRKANESKPKVFMLGTPLEVDKVGLTLSKILELTDSH